MKGYMGIDVGSSSVKIAIIDSDKKLIDSIYLKNRGLIETLKQGFRKVSNDYKIVGTGMTGSGRSFAGILVGADVTKTEVLAHTIAALHYHPEVRTLMDIGAEDSKLMSIDNGVLENFILNTTCSAGTGSSLEAIASRMGIPIEDVGDYALQSKQRLEFPSKCGVFTQSSVVSRLNSGANKSDILAGVVRALVSNYLTMANGIKLGQPYVYQGATAKNRAIVKALEEQLGSEVIVPEHCDIMGAIGIALMTRREYRNISFRKTKFKGFRISDHDFRTKIRSCIDCENCCELNEIYENSELIGVTGSRCGKYEHSRQ